MGLQLRLPSGYVKIAIENGHRNSGFSHENMVIFYSYVSLPEVIKSWLQFPLQNQGSQHVPAPPNCKGDVINGYNVGPPSDVFVGL